MDNNEKYGIKNSFLLKVITFYLGVLLHFLLPIKPMVFVEQTFFITFFSKTTFQGVFVPILQAYGGIYLYICLNL